MKKATPRKRSELRKEYDLKAMAGGVRGKYHRRYVAGTNLVLLDPDVSEAFPNAKAVNDALRVLAKAARKRARRKKSS